MCVFWGGWVERFSAFSFEDIEKAKKTRLLSSPSLGWVCMFGGGGLEGGRWEVKADSTQGGRGWTSVSKSFWHQGRSLWSSQSLCVLLAQTTEPHPLSKNPQGQIYLVIQTFLYSWTAVPNLFGTRDQFRGRQFFRRPGQGSGGSGGKASDGSGGDGGDGERWGAADEASLTPPPPTSCCAARFLTGCGQVAVRGPGVGDPCSRRLFCILLNT